MAENSFKFLEFTFLIEFMDYEILRKLVHERNNKTGIDKEIT